MTKRKLPDPRTLPGPYVPVYANCPSGLAYAAGIPPNTSWKKEDYGSKIAITDRHAMAALDRLVTGPLNDWETIDTLELILRGIILHEQILVMIPAVLTTVEDQPLVTGEGEFLVNDEAIHIPKYPYPDSLHDFIRPNGIRGYAVHHGYLRFDKEHKMKMAQEFWRHNYERLRSTDDEVVRQVFDEALAIDAYRRRYFASAKAIGAGSYFGRAADRVYEHSLQESTRRNVPERILKKLDDDWAEQIIGEGIGINVGIGPFLAITLNRAKNRHDILNVITDLRAEFADARPQLWEIFQPSVEEKRIKVIFRKRQEREKAISSIIPRSFPKRDRPLQFLWDSIFPLIESLTTHNPLPALHTLGNIGLKNDFHFRQTSTIRATKLLSREISNIELGLTEQLKKHLYDSELRSLGIT